MSSYFQFQTNFFSLFWIINITSSISYNDKNDCWNPSRSQLVQLGSYHQKHILQYKLYMKVPEIPLKIIRKNVVFLRFSGHRDFFGISWKSQRFGIFSGFGIFRYFNHRNSGFFGILITGIRDFLPSVSEYF